MTPHSILAEVAPFADVPVEVVIELDRRMMRLRDILDLGVGSIIPMTKTAGDCFAKRSKKLDVVLMRLQVGRMYTDQRYSVCGVERDHHSCA